MKQKGILILTLFLLLTMNKIVVHGELFLNLDVTSTSIDGITHSVLEGTITKDGVTSDQVIHVLEGNPFTDTSLQVVTGDGYPDLSYGTTPLTGIASILENRHPYYDVLGGINGDFFNAIVGIPVEVYVHNGDVLSTGLGYNRTVIGFKDSGETVFGRPCFEGFEFTIYTKDYQERITLDVQGINKLPFDETKTTVYFENYTGVIQSGIPKLIVSGTNIKRDEYDTRYFGKGNYIEQTTDEVSVAPGTFVVVSQNPYVKDVVQSDDIIRVQEKMGCDFEDVNYAIGAWEELVTNGIATTSIPNGTAPSFKAPRTAIGVKADHTVFFVTVDGRQQINGMDGMTLYELAEFMVSLGAVTAYNLDGGGSTTMMTRTNETFQVTNSPSDGNQRHLSNGIFFVRGTTPTTKPPLEIPDLSEQLETPRNVYITRESHLKFDAVAHKETYIISIDGITYETTSRNIPVSNLTPGEHIIQIKAVGDGLFYADSAFSDPLLYTVFEDEINTIIETFLNHLTYEIND